MGNSKKNILENIRLGRVISKDEFLNISLDDLFDSDENGISYLEHLCKRRIVIPYYYSLKKEIENSLNALYMFAKYNYLDWFILFDNEDIFFQKVDTGETLIDYIFKNHVKLNDNFFESFKKRYEILDIIVNYNDLPLLNFISPVLYDYLLKKENGIYPVEK